MNESDRDLLLWAAKAASYALQPNWSHTDNLIVEDEYWDPINDDGDAFRLAVKLKLVCGFVQPNCWAELPRQYPSYEPHDPDPYAATRRAIVRAAAEIGRNMK